MIGHTGHGKYSIDIRFNQEIHCDILGRLSLALKPGVNNYCLRCADKTCKAFYENQDGKSFPTVDIEIIVTILYGNL